MPVKKKSTKAGKPTVSPVPPSLNLPEAKDGVVGETMGFPTTVPPATPSLASPETKDGVVGETMGFPSTQINIKQTITDALLDILKNDKDIHNAIFEIVSNMPKPTPVSTPKKTPTKRKQTTHPFFIKPEQGNQRFPLHPPPSIVPEAKDGVDVRGSFATSHIIPSKGETIGFPFDLSSFLRKICKNAILYDNFLEQIQITSEDLQQIEQNGFLEGMTILIQQKLAALDIKTRPIHCVNLKTYETYFRFEHGRWKKDTIENENLLQMVYDFSQKIDIAISEFREKKPKGISNKEWNEKCDRIMKQASGGFDRPKHIIEISKRIAKFVHIDINNLVV
jgi:hypothetical protein